MLKKIVIVLVVSLFVASAAWTPASAIDSSCPTFTASDMVKVKGKPAIYILNNRLEAMYFPNGDVFKSWQPQYGGYTSIEQKCFDSLAVPSSYPGGVNFRPGTYLVKRPSSSQLYAIEPNNTLAKITVAAAKALYGANYAVMTIKDSHWPNYVNRGANISAAKAHPGMVVSVNGNVYYVDANNILHDVTTQGFGANKLQTKFVKTLGASAISGLTKGEDIQFSQNELNDQTQTIVVLPTTPTPTPTPTPQPGATVPTTSSTYYVAANGNNSNNGSSASPWATPAYGAAQLKPGDTLIIRGGTYVMTDYENDIVRPVSGNADNYVTIKGEDNNRPVLAGGNNLLTAIDLSNKNYVKIVNLEIKSNNGANFRDGIQAIDGPANHITLEDLYIHNLDEFGINIGDTNDIKIINSIISYTGYGAIGGPAGQQGGWRNALISGSTLSYSGHYFQGQNKLGPYDRPDGFGIESSVGPIEIANTTAEHNRGDGLDSKAENTYIHDSVVANNSCDGVKLWGTGSKLERTLIYGRGDGNSEPTSWAAIVIHTQKDNAVFTLDKITVDDALGTNYLMHVQYDYPNTPITLTIKNSIFSSRGLNAGIYTTQEVNYSVTNSNFYFPNTSYVWDDGGNRIIKTGLGTLGDNNTYGEPKFISPAWGTNGDYHLGSDSAATASMGYYAQ